LSKHEALQHHAAFIHQLLAQGMSQGQIAARLQAQHGVVVDRRVIGAWLKKERPASLPLNSDTSTVSPAEPQATQAPPPPTRESVLLNEILERLPSLQSKADSTELCGIETLVTTKRIAEEVALLHPRIAALEAQIRQMPHPATAATAETDAVPALATTASYDAAMLRRIWFRAFVITGIFWGVVVWCFA